MSDERMRSFFILSAPRSGSTLLATMLGVHRRIVVMMESFWFVAASWELKRLQHGVPAETRAERMVAYLETVEALEQLSTPPETLRAIVIEHQRGPDRILPALVEDYARRSKPSADFWGEKTPPHAFYVDDLERVFPDTRYIYLARDPRANVHSLAKPSYEDYSNDWQVSAHLYAKFNGTIERRLAAIAPERHLGVHYEDLIARPSEELRRCCDFLGIEFDEAMLAHQRVRRNLAGLGSMKAAGALQTAFVDEWRRELTPVQIRCIEHIASGLQAGTPYSRTNPPVGRGAYAITLATMYLKHGVLTLTEALVKTVRRRPFVWTRWSLMLGRFGRRLVVLSRELKAVMDSRGPFLTGGG
jgi:hypothetical protein